MSFVLLSIMVLIVFKQHRTFKLVLLFCQRSVDLAATQGTNTYSYK